MKFITSDKIFYHPDILDQWRHKKIVRPVTFEIHPSNRCNNNCYYCSAAKFKDGSLMQSQELEAAIRKLFVMGVKGLIFSGGGEPLCNPATIEAVVFSKRLGLSVGFITNGLLLNAKVSRILLKNCEWIRISLDSLDSLTYKKIRGADSLKEVEKGIKTLLGEKARLKSVCTVGVQSVINKYNCGQIPEFIKKSQGKFKGLDYIQIRPLEVISKNSPYSAKELAWIKRGFFLAKKNNLLVRTIISVKWNLIFGKREYGFTACHSYGMIGAVDSHGDIYICCHMVGNDSFRYGNIFRDSINKIFRQRELVARKTIKYKISRLCPVGCRGSSINRRLEGLLCGIEHSNFL